MPTQERVEQNERLFRAVNERIAEVTERLLDANDADADFYCECARPACLERIQLTLDEYRRIRADRQQFVIVPGHELLDFERVVRREASYFVVEKPA